MPQRRRASSAPPDTDFNPDDYASVPNDTEVWERGVNRLFHLITYGQDSLASGAVSALRQWMLHKPMSAKDKESDLQTLNNNITLLESKLRAEYEQKLADHIKQIESRGDNDGSH